MKLGTEYIILLVRVISENFLILLGGIKMISTTSFPLV